MTDAAAALVGEFASAVGVAPGAVEFVGVATLRSAYPVSDLAAASVGVAALATARYAGASSAVVHRELADGWFGPVVVPGEGTRIPSPWDPLAGNYRTRDGWIRLHTNAPAHRRAALAALELPPETADRERVAAAVVERGGTELEDAVVAAGGAAGESRTGGAWAEHPQGRAVSAEPLVARERTATGADTAATRTHRPLAGVRVLDLTRVLAGPTATQFLAGLGADVLRLDPPEWDEPGVLPLVMSGKRSARVNARTERGAATVRALLAGADVIIHGLRPGAIDGLGLGLAERARIRPGLVDVSLDAYGGAGPWAGRRAFDSVVQLSAGIADTEAGATGSDAPGALPVQALDVATGYLMAATALAGLAARRSDGRGTTARLSLARTALELERTRARVASGALERADPVDAPAPRRQHVASAWGPLLRLAPPAVIPGVDIAWDRPPAPLGGDDPVWLPR